MDRLNTELNNRIDEIKKRFSYIQNNYSGEFKKDLILYDIIISYLNKIDCILDDYELGKTLGVGGFGKVVLGKHREKKNEVAIKFTDVGDQLSSANLIQ